MMKTLKRAVILACLTVPTPLPSMFWGNRVNPKGGNFKRVAGLERPNHSSLYLAAGQEWGECPLGNGIWGDGLGHYQRARRPEPWPALAAVG